MKLITEEFTKLFVKSDKSDAEILCTHWISVRNDLLESLNQIKLRLAIIDDKIKEGKCESLIGSGVIEFGGYDQEGRYDQNMQWKEKAIYVMRKAKKPMNSTEVTNAIFQLEFNPGETKKDANYRRRSIQQSISGILADNTKDKVKTKAIFLRVTKRNDDDPKEQIRFWFADEPVPGDES